MITKVLFFSAPWCGPCGVIKSFLNTELASEWNITTIDITEDIDLSTKYNISSVPTFVKIKVENDEETEIDRINGAPTITKLEKFCIN